MKSPHQKLQELCLPALITDRNDIFLISTQATSQIIETRLHFVPAKRS